MANGLDAPSTQPPMSHATAVPVPGVTGPAPAPLFAAPALVPGAPAPLLAAPALPLGAPAPLFAAPALDATARWHVAADACNAHDTTEQDTRNGNDLRFHIHTFHH